MSKINDIKPREFYIRADAVETMIEKHHIIIDRTIHLKQDLTAIVRPEEWILVREVVPDSVTITREEFIRRTDGLMSGKTQQTVLMELFGE